MTGYRKCEHALEHDVLARHATGVNKGARKIMSEGPDELTLMLTWTALASAFVLLLVGATCLVLSVESHTRPTGIEQSTAACATARPHCSSCKRRDVTACRTDGLTALQGMGVGDVHYVFTDVKTVSRMALCSVESALRAADNGSRVNVFVVRDVEDQSNTLQRNQVSLSKGLSTLSATYGVDHLNVVRVGLDECAECSPFRDALPDLRRWPGLAKFAAQLTVLWQFGGTVLDPGVVAVRGRVYRANGTAVEYGSRTVSAPIACHAFVYEAMLRCVESLERRNEPFGPDAARDVWTATAEQFGREEARPTPQWIVQDLDSIDGQSYYAEMDRGGDDDSITYRDFCPTVFYEPDNVASTADDG